MTTDVYKVGSMITDDDTGWVLGNQATKLATRAKLANKTGGDLIVTVGKTLIISQILWMTGALATTYPILMYDDDGAGTNEVTVCKLPAGSVGVMYPSTPCYIEIPSGKYVTVKSSVAGSTVYIEIVGFER